MPCMRSWMRSMEDSRVCCGPWGGLRLIWFDRRRYMVDTTDRYGPVLLPVLEAALIVGLTCSLLQHYGSLVIVLPELTGLGLVVAGPVLIALVHVIRTMVTPRRAARHHGPEPERRVRPVLPLMLGVLSLATLLVLWLSAPLALDKLMIQHGLPTAGVVVSSADHHTAEAVLDQRAAPRPPSLARTSPTTARCRRSAAAIRPTPMACSWT
jgi:hypothetical protein